MDGVTLIICLVTRGCTCTQGTLAGSAPEEVNIRVLIYLHHKSRAKHKQHDRQEREEKSRMMRNDQQVIQNTFYLKYADWSMYAEDFDVSCIRWLSMWGFHDLHKTCFSSFVVRANANHTQFGES